MQSEQRVRDGEQEVCFFWWLGAWENHVRVHPSLSLWLHLLYVPLHYVKFFHCDFHTLKLCASVSVSMLYARFGAKSELAQTRFHSAGARLRRTSRTVYGR